MRTPRVFCLVILVLTFLAAAPAGAVTVGDGDDVRSPLDLRSVAVRPIKPLPGDDMERSRVTFAFWNTVPMRLLRSHPIEIDLSAEGSGVSYRIGIFRNGAGRLRIIWGEFGSNCCFRLPAQRLDRFTYTGKLSFNIFGAVPPPESFRGWSSRRVECDRPSCYFVGGKKLDKTRWAVV